MSEFSSLNGYTVKDVTARNIAKGRNQAVAFNNYLAMITALNSLAKGEYSAGQNIYIGVVGVPDLWVYSVENTLNTFDYVSDEDVVEKLTNNVTIQCGYYKLAMLEGQKVDLTTYDEAIQELKDADAELNSKINIVTESIEEEMSCTSNFYGSNKMYIHNGFFHICGLVGINGSLTSNKMWTISNNIKNFIETNGYEFIENSILSDGFLYANPTAVYTYIHEGELKVQSAIVLENTNIAFDITTPIRKITI